MTYPPSAIRSEGERADDLSRLVDSLSLNNTNSSSSRTSSLSTATAPSTSINASLPPPVPTIDAGTLPTSNSTFVLFQPDCSKHRYIRNHHDLAEIVERPERIRAVKAGVAAAWSKYERSLNREKWSPSTAGGTDGDDELGNLMQSLSIGGAREKGKTVVGKSSPFDILVSNDQLSIDSPALQLIHGVPNYPPDYYPPPERTASTTPATVPSSPSKDDSPPLPSSSRRRSSPRKPPPPPSSSALFLSESPWPTQLVHLIDQIPSTATTASGRKESEIPPHLPQGDLYLCSESKQAIFGALGAVCKGVDLVMNEEKEPVYRDGFVVVRPPGHHCGEANPQGFCFVNNVAVAAAHAHLEHGINRVVILDIDLHHGNGTQEIVWQLNEKANQTLSTYRERLAENQRKRASPRKSTSPSKSKPTEEEETAPRPLQIMYSSLHDAFSFPCESGDPSLIAAASVQISGPHSQFIHNTHLEPYTSVEDFQQRLWPQYRDALGGSKVEGFLRKTGAKEDETLVLVSAGFDASIHEYSSMSRHGLNVPPSFYSLFSSSIKRLAQRYTNGRVLFVLEGGYSDRALVSGSLGVLRGLLGEEEEERTEDLDRIVQVCGLGTTSTTTRKKGGGNGLRDGDESWIKSTKEIFDYIDDEPRSPPTTTSSRTKTSPPIRTPVTEVGATGSRQLRERKIKMAYAGLADMAVPLVRQHQQTIPNFGAGTGGIISATQAQNDQISTTNEAGLPPLPSTSSAAFSSIPSASFYPTATTGDEAGGGESTQKRPAIKFVWKQGGIGSSSAATRDEPSKGSLGEPRM